MRWKTKTDLHNYYVLPFIYFHSLSWKTGVHPTITRLDMFENRWSNPTLSLSFSIKLVLSLANYWAEQKDSSRGEGCNCLIHLNQYHETKISNNFIRKLSDKLI